jgi:2-dehydropantoate 2-reductase
MLSNMRVIVFGAGAVGSVIGGRLHQGGVETVLVGRAAHVDAIRSDGLRLVSADGVDRIEVPAVTTIHELTPSIDDVVLITAKTQDTHAIHDELLMWNPTVAVVCGTNGVEHERMALRRFDRVYGMLIQLPAQYLTPGEVTAWCLPTNAIIDLGRYPHGTDALSDELADAIQASPALLCESDPLVMSKKYDKILLNLGNAAEAACGFQGRFSPPVEAAQQEARDVYRAAGIQVFDELVDEATRQRYADRRATMQLRPIKSDADETGAGRMFTGGSTWQSLARGATSLETDYFNGEITLLGRLHGVRTPHNSFLQRLADRLVHDRQPPQSMSIDDLVALWRTQVGQP